MTQENINNNNRTQNKYVWQSDRESDRGHTNTDIHFKRVVLKAAAHMCKSPIYYFLYANRCVSEINKRMHRFSNEFHIRNKQRCSAFANIEPCKHPSRHRATCVGWSGSQIEPQLTARIINKSNAIEIVLKYHFPNENRFSVHRCVDSSTLFWPTSVITHQPKRIMAF